MFLIVDLVVIAIIALCVLIGYKRGLAKCVISILSFFIALFISIALFKPTANFVINNTEIDENIQSSIVQVFENESENNKEKDENSSPIVKYISEEIKDATEEKKKEIINTTAKKISINIVNVLAFISLFIIARFALIFVKVLADLITKLPIIKECDKIGGVIYGLLQSLIIIIVLFALITFISTMTNNYSLLETINQSYVAKFLLNNNLLLKVIF